MSVSEAKLKHEVAKAAVVALQKKQADLIARVDTLRESLPGFQQRIAEARQRRQVALDAFILGEGEKSLFEKANLALEKMEKENGTEREVMEAAERGVKSLESELPKLHTQAEFTHRMFWQAIADEIKTAIPSEVFKNIQKLFVIGSQTGQTRQWILDSLFPNIPPAEFQTIRNELVKKYAIDE